MKDLYYILGTERDCTPAELNTAYRILADKLRPSGQPPDRFLDDHFTEITDAYAILSDPARRKRYDQAFKKSNQRMLRHFRTRYINIAVTLALVTFTALFGMYVMKVINGHATKKALPALVQQVAAAPQKKWHKKHGYVKALPAVAVYHKPESVKDTVADDWSKSFSDDVPSTKAAPLQITSKAIAPVVQPAVTGSNNNDDQQSAGYTTYLKANATGVVSLHSTASYRSAVVANIPNNAKVTVMDKGQGFARISFNGQMGYVPGWAVGQ